MHEGNTGDSPPPADPKATPYSLIGGDAGVRALVDRFYDLMELDPDFASIRALHPERITGSRDKLYMFLSGWLGGPSLYTDRYGHPRQRARHLPFAIASNERDQWLACMRRAMTDTCVPDDLAERLMQAFYETADWMRNREG